MLICPEGVVKIAPRADINKFVTSILCFSAKPEMAKFENLGRRGHYYLLLL